MQQTKKSPFWVRGFRSFLSYRELLAQLVIKDLKNKYKRSALGYLWSVLNPLLTMAVLVAVFSNLLGRGVDNFPIYLLCGQLMMHMLTESTNRALVSITHGASIIQQVYIPKFILPLSSVISALVNQLFSFIALIVVMIATRYMPPPTTLLFFIPLIYELLFCVGLGMCLATAMVFFRDTQYLYGVFTLLWTYTTPIFYQESILPENVLAIVRVVNPMYHYVGYMRGLVLYGTIPGLLENLICLAYAVVFLVIGTTLFYKQQKKFVFYL